jgi:uncharacterized membrane protein YuzA (DUF378 family)
MIYAIVGVTTLVGLLWFMKFVEKHTDGSDPRGD